MRESAKIGHIRYLIVVLLLSISTVRYFDHSVAAAEPTDAKEAAAKKAKENAAVVEKFAAWKATLPQEQQAWETVLEENLGSFYLPIYQRQKLAGRVTAWDYVVDDPQLPRVLLIGDSVSRGYTLATRKALAGVANVHRAPANCGSTATGLKKLDIWLGNGNWDLIHFNFGIHDRKTSVADYESRLETLVERLEKTGAKLVWATSTPIPPDWKEGPTASAALRERNRIANKVMSKHHISIDDLYSVIMPQLKETQNPQDLHFNSHGYDILGQQVADSIQSELKK